MDLGKWQIRTPFGIFVFGTVGVVFSVAISVGGVEATVSLLKALTELVAR